MTNGHTPTDYKTNARRLRDALATEGFDISHAKALELVAKQNGARDWNTLSARPVATSEATGMNEPKAGAPFVVGENVAGTFNGNPPRAASSGLRKPSSRICGALPSPSTRRWTCRPRRCSRQSAGVSRWWWAPMAARAA